MSVSTNMVLSIVSCILALWYFQDTPHEFRYRTLLTIKSSTIASDSHQCILLKQDPWEAKDSLRIRHTALSHIRILIKAIRPLERHLLEAVIIISATRRRAR